MTRLSVNAIIRKEKLTRYLLILQLKDDKSKFLARAGYTLQNWQQLQQDLRTQVLTQPAEFHETTQYGDKYFIRTALVGPNQVQVDVVTVWIVTESETRFVTLVPDKGVN